jgi:hypothetical protein
MPHRRQRWSPSLSTLSLTTFSLFRQFLPVFPSPLLSICTAELAMRILERLMNIDADLINPNHFQLAIDSCKV